MRFLSLFSGIGGLDKGLEDAGMTCVGQVEIDPYCRAVLAKHWPTVKQMSDVREVKGDEFGPVDLVCGGVPCQPASCAGKRKGADDERWLWGEFVRVVRESRCSWFLAENVRGFLSLADAPGVVRDLERAGFEVRTLLLGAHHVGAPHRRDRIWIVGRMADAGNRGVHQRSWSPRREVGERTPERNAFGGTGPRARRGAHPEQSRRGAGSREQGDEGRAGSGRGEPARGVQLADAQEPRREGHEPAGNPRAGRCSGEHGQRWPSSPGEPQHEWEAPRLVYAQCVTGGGGDAIEGRRSKGRTAAERPGAGGVAVRGEPESRVGSAVDGLPGRLVGPIRGITGWDHAEAEKWWRRNRVRMTGVARMKGLKSLCNAVVPLQAFVVGRAIMEAARC